MLNWFYFRFGQILAQADEEESTDDEESTSGIQSPDSSEFGLPEVEAGATEFQSILAVVFGVAAAVAILIIIIASLNIATGGGDPEKISRGKKTIILALIGLAIAVTGEMLVLTILTRI